MQDIHMGKDGENETAVTIYIKSSKTDQYNLGAFKTLKCVPCEVWHVKMWAKYMQTIDYQPNSTRRIFTPNLRVRMDVFFRMIGSTNGIPASRIGNRSLQSGGAAAMFQAGFDVELSKHWGGGVQPLAMPIYGMTNVC